jgi:hypothetical protein
MFPARNGPPIVAFSQNGTLLEGEQKKTTKELPVRKSTTVKKGTASRRRIDEANYAMSSLEYSGTGHSETWPLFSFAYFVH